MFLKIFALVKVIDEFDLKILANLVNILNHDHRLICAMTTRKCERYARECHANVKSLHACVFLLSNSEKLIEKTFKTTLRQNNTKIWAAYGTIGYYERQ